MNLMPWNRVKGISEIVSVRQICKHPHVSHCDKVDVALF